MIINRYLPSLLALGMLTCGAVHAASPAETAAGVMRTLGAELGDVASGDVYLRGKRSLALALADICREGRVELRHLPLLETALECLPAAGRRRESAAIAARLLAAGANPNGAEDDGAPLCIAVEQGNTELFHLLRSAGARLDVKDSLGYSLLYLAAQHHHTKLLAALLDAGLQPELTSEGYALLHVAISPPEQEGCCCGRSAPDEAAVIATCRLLIQRGADVNAAAKDGCTPLLWNMREHASRPETIRLLLANGADANARDAAGYTALDYALRGKEADSCRLLLEAGAQLGKGSPLQLAVLLGDEAEVRRLLPGAPPLSDDERPLLLTALHARQWAVCRALLEAAGEIKFTQTLRDALEYMKRSGEAPVPHDILELMAQHMPPADGLRLAVKTGDAELGRKCLQRGADARDIKLLHDAVQEGSAEIARLLIEHGADVNGADDRGFTPLYRAAWRGGAEMVRLLLAAGANPNGVEVELVEQKPGQRAVLNALFDGDVCASSAEPRKRTVHYYPLLAAMCSGSEEVRLLLDAAAEPGLNSPEVLSVLSGVVQDHVMYICSDTEVLKLLLDRGLSLRGNRSVLQARGMRLIMEQDIDMLEQLQAAGAQLDDWSPLHLEVYLNRPEKCRRLLADGADVNAQDAKGDTPLMVAVKLGRESLIGLLLAAGARADLPNKEGVTPINADLRGYSSSMTSCLLNAGALKDPHTPEAQEALHRMSRYGHESAVYGLLRAGVDPNARDDAGRTPLHTIAAAEYNCATPLIVRLLLAYGADSQAKDAEGRTPAQLAEGNDTLAPAVRKLLNKHTNNE